MVRMGANHRVKFVSVPDTQELFHSFGIISGAAIDENSEWTIRGPLGYKNGVRVSQRKHVNFDSVEHPNLHRNQQSHGCSNYTGTTIYCPIPTRRPQHLGAASKETFFSVAADGSAGGTAGLVGAASVFTLNTETKASIDDNAQADAEGNVSVVADGDTQIQTIDGGLAFGGTAGFGASNSTIICDQLPGG